MNMADALAVAGVVVSVPGVAAAWFGWRVARRERSLDRFAEIRETARREQARLSSLALSSSDPSWRSEALPTLTKPGWILPRPIPLENVQLDWQEVVAGDGLTLARNRATRIMPSHRLGGRYRSYSHALTKLGGMSHLYNGKVYRPVGVDVDAEELRLTFAPGFYFDHLDTSEVLAYEAGSRYQNGKRAVLRGPYRKWLGDPFDLVRRSSSLGVLTLTVRQTGNTCTFFMHQRDGDHVVAGSDVIHVIPAGEFTPADVGLEAMHRDFNIWHTIMREYSEELLDIPEAYGKGGRPFNYDKDKPFKQLNAARRAGDLKVHVLGIGLDPLTWKPEIFTVCMMSAKTFDSVFAHMVPRNPEGVILAGPGGKGLPFDSATVNEYADNPNTRPGARTTLMLAWRHRELLGIST